VIIIPFNILYIILDMIFPGNLLQSIQPSQLIDWRILMKPNATTTSNDKKINNYAEITNIMYKLLNLVHGPLMLSSHSDRDHRPAL